MFYTINEPVLFYLRYSDPLTQLYSITYMYYALIGCFITVFVGVTVSIFTGFNENELYDEKLIHPTALKVASWFPGRKRRYANKKCEDLKENFGNGNTNNASSVDDINLQGSKDVGISNASYSQAGPSENLENYKTRL